MNKNGKSFLYLFFLIIFFTHTVAMEVDDDIPILGKEDREILEEEIEQELQFRREWQKFLEPIKINFKIKHVWTFNELKEGETIELSEHEVYPLRELAQDFIKENLIKICNHAIETQRFIAKTKEADRFTYSYCRIFTEWFKEDLLSYFKEERAVYLAMNKNPKKSSKKGAAPIFTETIAAEEACQEDKETLEKEIEQELQSRREWQKFLEPMRIDFKKKNARTISELKEGETIELSDHEVYLLGDLVRDFIRENLMKACDHAIETRGFIAGTKEAVRFTYRYGRIFTESFKEDLISYFKEERAVYLAMNKDRKKKTAYILTEKLNIEVSEEDTVTW